MPDDFATALAKSKAPKAPPAFGEALAMARGKTSEPKIEDVRGAIFGNAGTEDALPFSEDEKVAYMKRFYPGEYRDPGSEVLSPDEQRQIYEKYKAEPWNAAPDATSPEFTRRTSIAAFDKLIGNRTRSEVDAAVKKFEGDPATKAEQAQYLAGRFVSGMNAPAMGYAAKLFGPGGVLENPASLEAAANVADPSRASLGSRRDRVKAAVESTTTGRIASGAAEFLGATPGLILSGKALTQPTVMGAANPLATVVPSMAAGPTVLGLQGLAASGGDMAAAGEGVMFGALAGALSAPIKAVISRWPPAIRSQAIDRLATMAGGGVEFAAADALLHGPDGERALANFIFGAGMKSVGKTAGMERAEGSFEANKGVMPTETPFAPGLPRRPSPTPGVEAPEQGPVDGPRLIVPDSPNLKRGPSGTEVMADVARRVEKAGPVNEAIRRFEERTGIRVATESAPIEKPVSVAPKAPPEAPREAPKATPKPMETVAPPVSAPRMEGVSIKNAAVEANREARGAEPLPETAPEKRADWVAEATKRIAENPNYPVELIDNLKRTGRPHDKVEVAALTEHRVKLNESLAKAEADVLAAAERGDVDGVREAKIRADNLRTQDFEVSEVVGKAAGAEAARALGARAMALDQQYELLPMETQRRVVNNGRPLTEAQKSETKALHQKFVEAKALAKRAADLGPIPPEATRLPAPTASVATAKGADYGRRNTFISREAYEATRASIREKLYRMNVGVDPTMLVDLAKIGAFHIEAGARSFASWSKAMIEDMGEAARPHLREVWRASRLSMGDPGKPQAERVKALTSRMEMAAADYNARVATGNLKKAPREPVVMNKAAIEAEAKMIEAKRRWEAALLRDEWNNKTPGQKAVSMALSGLHNIPRALMAGLDLSATLMQGGIGFISRPGTGIKSFVESVKAFRSQANADRSEAQIRLDPMYHAAKTAKLFLAEHNTHAPKNMEEVMVSGLLSKIPILAGSQRAYAAFMNRMRFDMFKAGIASMAKDGAKPTPAEMKAWASVVNTFTGRAGDVNSRALNGAAEIFWAPRLVLSRFQMLTGYPLLSATGAARKLAAKEYARYGIGLALIYGMAKLSGNKIDDDGKIQVGDTKIDPTSGLSSAFRFLKQMGGAAKDTIQGRDTDNTRNAWNNVVRYGRYKLAPLWGAGVSALSRKDAVGRKTDIGTEAEKLVTPLSVKDIKAAFEAHDIPEATVLSILTLLGVRSSEKPTKGR